jgi:hypothetical protein
MYFNIGPVNVLFKGYNDIAKNLINEYLPLENKQKNLTPDIIFDFENFYKQEENQRYFFCSDNRFNEKNIFLNSDFYKVRLSGSSKDNFNAEPTLVQLQFPFKRNSLARKLLPYNLWNFLYKFKHRDFYSREKMAAKAVIYGLFDGLLHIELLQKGAAFIHASAIEKDDKAYVFPAWGGAGKTSTILQLLKEEDYRFLGDDLSIISQDGLCYLNPKHIHIYPYNLVDDDYLNKKLMENKSFIDKFQWSYMKRFASPGYIRRRVPPDEMFGKNKVSLKSEINKVVLLARTNSGEFSLEELDSSVCAEKCTSIMMFEINSFIQHILAFQMPDGNISSLPSLKEIYDKTFDTYKKIFENKPCQICFIPAKAKPKELSEFIKNSVIS